MFWGYIKIPEPGDWTFHCQAKGGMIFKIHNKLVIDGDYKYEGGLLSSTVKLDKGVHPYRLYYIAPDKEPSLNLQWQGPNSPMGLIPADALLTFTVKEEQKHRKN